jgi:cytochrome b
MKMAKQAIIVAALMVGAVVALDSMPVASALLTQQDNILGTEGDLRALVLRVINYFLAFLGLVCVILLIYAGVLYITAAGNDENITKAKGIMKNTMIGVIIILLAFAVVNFVLGAFTA